MAGVNLLRVYVDCAIYENSFGGMVFQRSMLDWREEGDHLPWVYMHCSIYIDVPSLV